VRRLARILLNLLIVLSLLTVMSLLLFAASVALWMRSYPIEDVWYRVDFVGDAPRSRKKVRACAGARRDQFQPAPTRVTYSQIAAGDGERRSGRRCPHFVAAVVLARMDRP